MKKGILFILSIPFILSACHSRNVHVGDGDESAVSAGTEAVAPDDGKGLFDGGAYADETAAYEEETDEEEEEEEAYKESSAKIITLSAEEFEKAITDIGNPKGFQYKGKTPCIVDFYADWCGPCRMIMPMMSEMAEKYDGRLLIYKVNVDRAPDVAEAFDIDAIPALLFFKPNAQPRQIIGAPQPEDLQAAIDDFLKP